MAALGLCATTRHYPDAAECAALGLSEGDYLRLHAYSLTELEAALKVIPAGIKVILTPNNELAEVGWDWGGWEDAMRQIAGRFSDRVAICGCGVELDLWHLQSPSGENDPRLTPGFAAELVRSAAAILHPAGIQVAMSSVASGRWPRYLSEMASYCRDVADYADLHLYMKRVDGVPNDPNWQSAQVALDQATYLAGVPVLSSEAGIKVDDAGGLEWQASWAGGLVNLQSPLVCYFAWSDAVGTPSEQGGQAFGALDPDGSRKPVWYVLQRLFGGPSSQPPAAPPEPTDPYFELGFARWAALEPKLIGKALRRQVGVGQGWATIPTSKGALSWVDGQGHLFVSRKGRVYRWNEDWPASREVLA